MVARPGQAAGAAAACGSGVDIVQLVNDDLWMRDMGPIFLVNDSGGLAGLDLNFNGWGNKQVHHNDAKISRELLSLLGVKRFVAPFVSEGGALEVDGEGTVLATESSIINANRNLGKTKAQLTGEILAYLGARKMLWVPGLKGHDITDDHIDGLARFVRPAKVVVDQPADPNATGVWADSERRALRILQRSTDAFDRPLHRLISRESSTIPPGEDRSTFVNVYVNWYVCNGAVMIPAFDDRHADATAKALARELYPDRDIVQLRIDTLAAGGGGIHCVTQQQPVPIRARRHSRRPTTQAGAAG
jgi:agmatine deiminase